MQILTVPPQITVVQPQGHINASNAPELQNQLVAAVGEQDTSVILVEMEQVESLDSAGLMALVSALTRAQHLNKRFSLCCVSASIRIIFELTQLDRVFEIFENRAAFEATLA